MKKILKLSILPGVILLIMALYSFASHRHESKKIERINISFTDYSDPFISEENVNKLLIQNQDSVDNLLIEKLDLNKSESRLVADPMIRTAEVSIDLNGNLEVIVEQREPLARIVGKESVYLDKDNLIMPLSKDHTALVPLITGFDPDFQNQIYDFLMLVDKDPLLKTVFTQIVLDKKGRAVLMMRSSDMRIKMGELTHLESKMNNFKAMLAKVEKDKTIDQIKSMDLRFDRQVIVVKK